MSIFSFFKKAFKGPQAKPIHLPAKHLGQAETIGDKLSSICASLNGYFERDLAGQDIRLCITINRTTEKYCGQGPTTQAAFEALYARLKKLELI